MNRRDFLQASIVGVVATAAGPALAADAPKLKLKKAVKYSMIRPRPDVSIEEKFKLIKKLGFLGVEMDSPSDVDKVEAVRARDATGIAIHGVIDSVHWAVRLSDPDAALRTAGLNVLKNALQDAKFYGADTVLLVPGVVNNTVTYQQCWERSQAEVRKAIPMAEKLGVKIAIEVVGNNFITKPEQMVEYVDQFKSPYVAAYFDCSNVVRHGPPPADWIRAWGKRMVKFDLKGYSKTKGSGVPIGEGDENWPDILKALAEVGYEGWATAEVRGGGEPELRDIAERMNKCLGL